MQYTTLGKTGLKVSVAGLGCGGNSRIGLGAGLAEAQSIALVQRALDLGVNFLDTALAYGTEGVVGKAIKGRPRDSVVISTKSHINALDGTSPLPAVRRGRQPGGLAARARHRLCRRLPPAWAVAQVLRPGHGGDRAGAAAREGEGQAAPSRRLRDRPARSRAHHAGARRGGAGLGGVHAGLPHDEPERAQASAAAHAGQQGRHALHVRGAQHLLQAGAAAGAPSPAWRPKGNCRASWPETKEPLGFLVHEGGAESLIDAAYRFARHEPGIDVVLFGTSSVAHLEANIASILRPPLPAADVHSSTTCSATSSASASTCRTASRASVAPLFACIGACCSPSGASARPGASP